MTKQEKNLLSTICNLYIVISILLIEIQFFSRGGAGNMAVFGARNFRFFTMDSNILMALTSAICLAFNIRNFRTGENKYPSWLISLMHMGTNAVTLTFIVVMVFLGPATSYAEMIEGQNLYMHLINPLVAIASFIFLTDDCVVERKSDFLATLPTLVYGIIYMYKVIVLGPRNGGWYDFYGFNIGGLWYITSVVIVGSSLGFAAALRTLHNKALSL